MLFSSLSPSLISFPPLSHPLPSLPLTLLFTVLRLKCFYTFLFLCSVLNRDQYDAVQVKCSLDVQELMFQSERTSMVVLLKSEFLLLWINKNVFQSLLGDIIYLNHYLRYLSKYPCSVFVLCWFRILEMCILNLNCKANSPKPFLMVSKQEVWILNVLGERQAKATPLPCSKVWLDIRAAYLLLSGVLYW